MTKTKTILASLVLAVSVTVIAVSAWVNRPTDSFFEANLEALANTETVIWGKCEEISGDCLAKCSICGRLFYANGHYGGSYDIDYACSDCK